MNARTVSDVRGWLVRDLVEQYPQTMALLVPYGIDLCCGGSREVGEALRLHGAPVDEVK
jgi:iron-sulfur cluster repair protein YtfE (RIC family)